MCLNCVPFSWAIVTSFKSLLSLSLSYVLFTCYSHTMNSYYNNSLLVDFSFWYVKPKLTSETSQINRLMRALSADSTTKHLTFYLRTPNCCYRISIHHVLIAALHSRCARLKRLEAWLCLCQGLRPSHPQIRVE